MTGLEQLNPLIMPPAIGFWPPAAGWWLLLIILPALCWGLWWLRRYLPATATPQSYSIHDRTEFFHQIHSEGSPVIGIGVKESCEWIQTDYLDGADRILSQQGISKRKDRIDGIGAGSFFSVLKFQVAIMAL